MLRPGDAKAKALWRERKQAFEIDLLFKNNPGQRGRDLPSDLNNLIRGVVEKKTTFYPEETLQHANDLCKFLFQDKNHALAKTVMGQAADGSKGLVLAVNSWKFAFSNTNDCLENFLFGTGLPKSRVTKRVVEALGCRKVGTDKIITVYDGHGNLVLDHIFDSIEEDQNVYEQFILDRMEVLAANRGGEDIYTDKGMEKYMRPLRPDLTAGQGMSTLTVLRQTRDQPTATKKLLKRSMSSTPTIASTTDKYVCKPKALQFDKFGLVLFYGTGSVEKKSRFAYSNVYCVDPEYDGPPSMGYKGTHKQFHAALLANEVDIVPVHICSDASGHVDTDVPLTFRGSSFKDRAKLRQLDITSTNNISNAIYSFWREHGYTGEYELVMGVTDTPPEPIASAKADLGAKVRPTNGELDAHLHRDAEKTVSQVLQLAGGNIYISNIQRLFHETEGTFPERDYNYPDNFEEIVENVRTNCILIPPARSGAITSDVKQRKFFFKLHDTEADYDDADSVEPVDWDAEIKFDIFEKKDEDEKDYEDYEEGEFDDE